MFRRRLVCIALCCIVVGVTDYVVLHRKIKLGFRPKHIRLSEQGYSGNIRVGLNILNRTVHISTGKTKGTLSDKLCSSCT